MRSVAGSTGSPRAGIRRRNAGPGIAGATVEVLKSGTSLGDTNDNNIVSTTATDASGNYTFAFLAPGTYVIRATPPAASADKPALLAGGVTCNGEQLADGPDNSGPAIGEIALAVQLGYFRTS